MLLFYHVTGEFMQLGSKEDENERFSHYLQKTYKKTASLMAHSCEAVSLKFWFPLCSYWVSLSFFQLCFLFYLENVFVLLCLSILCAWLGLHLLKSVTRFSFFFLKIDGRLLEVRLFVRKLLRKERIIKSSVGYWGDKTLWVNFGWKLLFLFFYIN